MAHESFPNNAHNNRVVTLAEHEQIAAPLGLSGLLNYTSTAPIFADSTGRHCKLRAGVSASILGTRFNNLTETTISIGANTSGNTRIDLVVLRLRRQETSLGAGDQYTIVPHVIQGVPATNPVAPSLVRNATPGVGFWDVPLAEVTVPHNAPSIALAQVAVKAYFITGSGYAGRNAWGKPPIEPGVIFRANDVGITYIGTASGSWDPIFWETGPVAVTNGQSKAGWDFRNFTVSRSGNVGIMNMYIVRTGVSLSSSVHQYFGPVDEKFWPESAYYGAAHVGVPDHSTHAVMQADGVILLAANGTHGIGTGAQVLCNLSWPIPA